MPKDTARQLHGSRQTLLSTLAKSEQARVALLSVQEQIRQKASRLEKKAQSVIEKLAPLVEAGSASDVQKDAYLAAVRAKSRAAQVYGLARQGEARLSMLGNR